MLIPSPGVAGCWLLGAHLSFDGSCFSFCWVSARFLHPGFPGLGSRFGCRQLDRVTDRTGLHRTSTSQPSLIWLLMILDLFYHLKCSTIARNDLSTSEKSINRLLFFFILHARTIVLFLIQFLSRSFHHAENASTVQLCSISCVANSVEVTGLWSRELGNLQRYPVVDVIQNWSWITFKCCWITRESLFYGTPPFEFRRGKKNRLDNNLFYRAIFFNTSSKARETFYDYYQYYFGTIIRFSCLINPAIFAFMWLNSDLLIDWVLPDDNN